MTPYLTATEKNKLERDVLNEIFNNDPLGLLNETNKTEKNNKTYAELYEDPNSWNYGM